VYSSRATIYRRRSPGIQQLSYNLQEKISWYTAAELHSAGEDLLVYSSRVIHTEREVVVGGGYPGEKNRKRPVDNLSMQIYPCAFCSGVLMSI
jgi:hypothetical protein